MRDARHKPPTTKKNEPGQPPLLPVRRSSCAADDSRIPVQQPDQFDLREQGELVGLGNDATFGEMVLRFVHCCESVLSWFVYRSAPSTLGRLSDRYSPCPRGWSLIGWLQRAFSPDNEWKNVFLSALQTLLRETMYAKEPKQRQVSMPRWQWVTGGG